MKKITLRFYEELNDFLPKAKRKIGFEHNFIDRASVKDLIESCGVPHTEVDLILVNGKSENFSYKINDKDDISVYPVFESIDISSLQRLRPAPLRNPKFILDVHLGTLSKYLRMLGFDVFYRNNFSDEKIVKISLMEKRAVLTRDVGILKRSEVTRGYWIRNFDPVKQLEEVIKRFDLKNQIKEFSRCVECNSVLEKIDKQKIIGRLPPKVKAAHNDFLYCKSCDKIYWRGSHYKSMKSLIEKLKK
ncbi:MAG: Mut7-C RNAse domain-containing protein [Ignavibacteriaceae bacterium]